MDHAGSIGGLDSGVERLRMDEVDWRVYGVLFKRGLVSLGNLDHDLVRLEVG
jgi:hypothetical protein